MLLYIGNIRQELMRIKREAKKEHGPKSEWPDWLRAKYEDLKNMAREAEAA